MSNELLKKKNNIKKKRKIIDSIYNFFTYLSSSVGVFILGVVLYFIFSQGFGLLSFDLLIGDYHYEVLSGSSGKLKFDELYLCEKPAELEEGAYYSSSLGVAFRDGRDTEGKSVIEIAYIADDSPIKILKDKTEDEATIEIEEGSTLSKIIYYDDSYSFQTVKMDGDKTHDAAYVASELNDAYGVYDFSIKTSGGGIRGSMITTLYLIVLTLLIALPIGVLTAIYFNEYAKNSIFTKVVRTFVETLTGVPSVIFGLMGAAIFLPITGGSYNLIAGSLTLAVILLPVIIRSTEEALKVIPSDFRSASLALGANQTQTIFKVVLPSAVPGILTAVILSIGRIIGESAALIFVIGTAIIDNPSLSTGSTSLAVHIWNIMNAEVPNFELASAIAIIILFVVLVLNVFVKFLSNKINKAWY